MTAFDATADAALGPALFGLAGEAGQLHPAGDASAAAPVLLIFDADPADDRVGSYSRSTVRGGVVHLPAGTPLADGANADRLFFRGVLWVVAETHEAGSGFSSARVTRAEQISKPRVGGGGY